MIEDIIIFLQGLPPTGILIFAAAITFTENVFPPAPCDILLVFCGTLVGLGTVGWLPLILSSSAGSLLGFLLMYWIGLSSGKKMLHSGRLPFGSHSMLSKVQSWFQKYGYGLIVVNRFLSGTRAIISFFAGLAGLQLAKTVLLSACSALLWNGLLVYIGSLAGDNWREIQFYLSSYGKTITGIFVVVVLLLAARWYFSQQCKDEAPTPDTNKEEN